MKILLLVCSTSRSEATSYMQAVQRAGARVACVASPELIPDGVDVPLPAHHLSVEEALGAIEEWGGQCDGVLGVGLQGGVVAAHLATILGLDGHTPGGVSLTANKARLLRRLSAADLPLPDFQLISPEEMNVKGVEQWNYPQVLQPTIRKGLNPKIRVNDSEGALRFLTGNVTLSLLAPTENCVLREQCPPESETLVLTGLTHQGHFYPLAFLDRRGIIEGRPGKETVYLAPSRQQSSVLEHGCRLAASACSTIGLDDGPVQATLRRVGEDLVLLDVAGHPLAVPIARSLRFGKGNMTLEEVHVRHALRMEVDLVVREEVGATLFGHSIAQGAFGGLAGVEAAKSSMEVLDAGTELSAGSVLIPVEDGGHAPFWVSGRGGNHQALEDGLARAAEKIRIRVL